MKTTKRTQKVKQERAFFLLHRTSAGVLETDKIRR